ncbi:MAG: DNA-binding response regulator [Acidobacteria bacterium]|nr:MAG: DNA-binding response regulator [Acidobacteriota bacterium]
MRILVVEDNLQTAALICEVLREAYYAVDLAVDGARAAELTSYEDFDLVILDWQIPRPSGLELVHDWRQQGLEMPVLMLTVRDAIEDRVEGLEAGADDYLTKPFSVEELLARVRSLLRRRMGSLGELAAGDVWMDRCRRQVTVGGQPAKLSAREFALLEYLLMRKDEVVTRAEIENRVWDTRFDTLSNVVDVLVHRLRKKIDADHERRLLHTVHGVGYVLRSERS